MNCQGLKPLLCLMGRNENKEQVNGRDRVGPICHCLRGSSQASASEEQPVAQAGLGKHEHLCLQTGLEEGADLKDLRDMP